MSGSETDLAERTALLNAVTTDLAAVVTEHTVRMQAASIDFPKAQSIVIGALMAELARVIACGRAPLHRAHTKVVAEELGRLVAAAAVAMGPLGSGEDA
jgi:hypothetical protein